MGLEWHLLGYSARNEGLGTTPDNVFAVSFARPEMPSTLRKHAKQ